MEPKTICVIGGGRLGKSLAWQLKACGHNVMGLACGSEASSHKAAELTGIPAGDPLELAGRSDVVFITVPDDKLEATCRRLSGEGGIRPDTVVLHCSGSKPSTVLQTARDKGACIGSMHPLQSFTGFNKNVNSFINVNFTVEGDEKAVATGTALAMDLGAGRCYAIDTKGKILYHGAAVMVANYLVTLFNVSADLLEKAGIPKKDAFTVLGPLLSGTLKNLSDNAPYFEMALSGPISRGDVSVVAAHLDAIETAEVPNAVNLYKTLGRATIKVALRQGTLTVEAAQKLEELLAE